MRRAAASVPAVRYQGWRCMNARRDIGETT
jgi:hypothetical protein